MKHYSEDELILFFYDEGRRRDVVQRHLDECDACAGLYGSLARTLRQVKAAEVPERGEHYGLEVWQRLRPVLPVEPPPGPLVWRSWMRLATGAAVAATVVAAFVVGRSWPLPKETVARSATTASAPEAVATLDAADRVRMAAISDHLEESERLLIDFVNSAGQVGDVSSEQELAAELVEANRFFREASAGAGDIQVAEVLDSLERSLMEIAHGPANPTPDQFNQTRSRLDDAGLLFKLRVLSDELRVREASVTPSTRKTT